MKLRVVQTGRIITDKEFAQHQSGFYNLRLHFCMYILDQRAGFMVRNIGKDKNERFEFSAFTWARIQRLINPQIFFYDAAKICFGG